MLQFSTGSYKVVLDRFIYHLLVYLKWIVSAPEQAKVLTEFKNVFKHNTNPELDYRHHDETMSMQSAFQNEISSLKEKIPEYGNSSFDISDELIVLNSRICVAENCVKIMRALKLLKRDSMPISSEIYFQNDENT